MNTPILFLIFNRPDLTQRVFAVIKQVKPRKLFIAADGPRPDRIGEDELCKETRELVLNMVDWDCEVKTLFRESNLGCKLAVSGAIDWFFEQVEQGIILEDDCLPSQSFFNFCETLLDKYSFDDRIMHIGGTCFLPFSIKESYHFTCFAHIWGWATWRRAWRKYDVKMNDWQFLRISSFLETKLKNRRFVTYWRNAFDSVYNGSFDNWDFQWTYAIWKNNALAINASTNLITNIGFQENATHTVNPNSPLANLPFQEVSYASQNIIHPGIIESNSLVDEYVRDAVYMRDYASVSFFSLLKRTIRKVYNKLRLFIKS